MLKFTGRSPNTRRPPPDQDDVPLLVVIQAESMARPEGHQLPLRMQVEGRDHSGRLTLHQSEGLEARREIHWLFPLLQSGVAFPAEALLAQ